MAGRTYEDDRFQYEEVKEKGFIRTIRRPKPGAPGPGESVEDRVTALEADVAELKRRLGSASAINGVR